MAGLSVARRGAALACLALAATAASASARVYTADVDFDEGAYINVDHDVADQLRLDDTVTPFGFVWVANSGKGTIVKIDSASGAILGEYRSAPEGQPRNPSRTTVDNNGNVWAGNRDAAPGSVVHVGLLENGQCEDRNGNGTIETSGGLNDIRGWSNAAGVDTNGGVETAGDECIIHYTRVNAPGTRHVSVTPSNDVWVSGSGGANPFDLIDGDTGTVIRSEPSVGFGGYGGLITADGVIWSARRLLRWDTANPLTGAIGINWRGYGHDSYGLCIDPHGTVWNTQLGGNRINKFAPDGTLVASYAHGFEFAQGCVAAPDGDIYVAHSILGGGNSVGHLKNDGTFVGNIPVGNGPTGVAVDDNGKVWATNYFSQTVSRIDPNAGAIGGGGDLIGAVDLTSVDLGGGLYNYSDMTGSTLTGPPDEGSWTLVHDSGSAGTEWGTITRTADVPSGATLEILAASSDDGVTFSADESVAPDADLTVPDGRYLRVTVRFVRADSGESPVLYDLTIRQANLPPNALVGDYEIDEGDTVTLDALGSTDPDGDALNYGWDIDNDGTLEVSGPTASFTGLDGPAVHTVVLTACDPDGECDTDDGLVTVRNVRPSANAGPDQTVFRGETVNLAGTFGDPAASHDEPYGFSWTVPEGQDSSGSAAFGSTLPRTVAFSTLGTKTIALAVTDKDGGTGTDTLVVEVVNRAPDCAGRPTVTTLRPPNHRLVEIGVIGPSDPDGDPVSVTISSIRQDEPVNAPGDGDTAPDGAGVGTSTAQVRAERSGVGDGRVYYIMYEGDDGRGGRCSSVVQVTVPHSQNGDAAGDGGPLFDSTTA